MTREQPVSPSCSPEFRLVAACSWAPQNSARQSSLVNSLASENLNWDTVASLVNRHGVTGIFCLVMGRLGWISVPEATIKRLKGIRVKQTIRALGQLAELTRVGASFAEAGVAVIPLKGVALSQELYGDPAVRSAVDLDILVRGDDVSKAEDLLIALGYHHSLGFHGMNARQQQHILTTLHHHGYINDTRGVHVELHWRSFLWTEAQVKALWDNIPSAAPSADRFPQLAKEDNILFLADHGARHDWLCLKWLSDLAMLLERMPADEWDTLYDRAAYFDLQRVLLQTSVLLDWFYGIEPSPRARKMLAADRVATDLAAACATQLLASEVEALPQSQCFAGCRRALTIKKLKPSTSVTSLLRYVTINHTDFVECPLPAALYWLYLPLRPFFWFRRHFMVARRN